MVRCCAIAERRSTGIEHHVVQRRSKHQSYIRQQSTQNTLKIYPCRARGAKRKILAFSQQFFSCNTPTSRRKDQPSTQNFTTHPNPQPLGKCNTALHHIWGFKVRRQRKSYETHERFPRYAPRYPPGTLRSHLRPNISARTR